MNPKFQKAYKKSQRLLYRADRRFGADELITKHVDAEVGLAAKLRKARAILMKAESQVRIPSHYIPIHSMLEYLAGGNLRGKRILHIGAANGAYAKVLQEYYGAKAIALDIDHATLTEAKKSGVRHVITGNAIHEKKAGEFHMSANGLWLPTGYLVHLPFKDAVIDFIVSDHFLFSNFHIGYTKEKGFEDRPNSILQSENSLKEYNRILRPGGRLLVGSAHAPELPELRMKYRKGAHINGFIIEEIFDEDLANHSINLDTYESNLGKGDNTPCFFVLKKVGRAG